MAETGKKSAIIRELMPQNVSGRLKTCLLPEPMLSDGLRTALNDNSCEMGGIFCYTQRQVYLLMTILGVFLLS